MEEVIGGKAGLTKQFKFKSKQLRQGRSDQSKQFMLLLTSCSPPAEKRKRTKSEHQWTIDALPYSQSDCFSKIK